MSNLSLRWVLPNVSEHFSKLLPTNYSLFLKSGMIMIFLMIDLISKPVECRFVTANLGACQHHRKCRSQLLISPNADLLISGTT